MPDTSANTLKTRARTLIAEHSYSEAADIYRMLAEQNPEEPENWYTLGALALKQNNASSAEEYYSRVVRLLPDTPEALSCLAETQHIQGKYSNAIENYYKALSINQNLPNTLRNLGAALVTIGDYDKAISVYGKVININPDDAAVYYGLAYALHKRGSLMDAIENYKKALDRNPEFNKAQIDLGNAYLDIGERNQAVPQINKGLELDPGYAPAHVALGNLYAADLQIKDAIISYGKALELEPSLYEASLRLADMHLLRGMTELALDALHAVLDLQPRNKIVLAKLAEIHENIGDIDTAAERAGEVLAIDPEWGPSRLLLARIARYKGDLAEADSILGALEGNEPRHAFAASVAFERGRILDHLGEYDGAFQSFTDGHRLAEESDGSIPFDRERYLDGIGYYRDWFTRDRAGSWPTSYAGDEIPAPVFLIGFPRSGTTLAGQMLVSHPSITLLDEAPILATLRDRDLAGLAGPDGVFPDCLDGLSGNDVEFLRRRYWEYVSQYTDIDMNSTVLIDKLPLNLLLVSVIYRLFPQARLIVALRDPRDACLSSFMQEFSRNEAMAHFTNLDSTTRFYESVMKLWLHCSSQAELNAHELYYERLVANQESELKELLTFIGLDWDETVLNYHKQRGTYISTPSYHGVSEPVYGRSVGRWRHYRNNLAPYMARLSQFIRQYGYEEGE